MGEDPAAHLAGLRAEAQEAQCIVEFVQRQEITTERSPVHLDVLDRIDGIRHERRRAELLRVLEQRIYGEQCEEVRSSSGDSQRL